MTKPTLYLFIGYPGAGKTFIAQIIARHTGATHLWADAERHKLFDNPTHTLEESNELYDKLNAAAAYLLANGKSVVFDTNFNFLADREKLREIATDQGAQTIVIWVTTPVELAKKRAVHGDTTRNGYDMNMSAEQFDAIVEKLEPPTKDEHFIKIDGTKLDDVTVTRLLSL
jgi:predicted kinase